MNSALRDATVRSDRRECTAQRLTITTAISALALLACSPPRTTAPASSPAKVGTSYLAWGVDAAGNAATHWFDCVDIACELVDRRDGHVVADGVQLWELVLTDASYPSYVCEGDGAETGKHRLKRPDGVAVEGARVRRLGTAPAEHVVVPNPNPTDDDAFAIEYKQSLRVLGSVGSQVFIRVDSAGLFCGAAHETSGSSFVLWDLHTQTTRVPLDASFTPEERATVEGNEMVAARRVIDDKLRARNEDAEQERSLELVALVPFFGASGVAFDLMFAVPACRTCGDGIWSDYAIAARVPLRSPVKSLGRGLNAAGSLTQALAQRGLKLMGLSRVSGTASDRASARRQFHK